MNPFHTLSFYFSETRIDSLTVTNLLQEFLAKTNRLFSFDMTRTAQKTKKLGGNTDRQQDYLISFFLVFRNKEIWLKRELCV
jgi:hypothetical protein